MTTPITILIADDHLMIREGFRVLLKKQQRVKIIGEAENGEQLIRLALELQPDVVLTDIQMPVRDGISATREVRKILPYCGIIALTMFNEDHYIIDMLEAGARGYLLKNTTKEELLEAIDAVYKGDTYFCNATSKKLTALIAASKYQHANASKPQLTPIEIEIMRLICQEFSSKQIAAKLGYTQRTVENYREKIQEKIGARNMAGIAVYAIKNQYYTP
jgi:DNA-binding NarL/FixJ family response regulator